MQVIAEAPWSWFLLEDKGTLYLDVLVENGPVSYCIAAMLSPEQAADYARQGAALLETLSGEMRHKALTRQWPASPLPVDWNECSAAAVRAWRNKHSLG